MSIPGAWLDLLDARVAHRGPDGAGRFRARVTPPDGAHLDVAFVHRRLVIIDPETGAQPITIPFEGGRTLTVVFNGCIYNHREIRAELVARDRRLVTDHSDTEVIPQLVAEIGPAAFERFVGMGAAAVFDHDSGQTYLYRDPFGEKPLYVWDCPGSGLVAFSSNAIALAELRRAVGHPSAERLDHKALSEWIALGYHASETPFSGVIQLPPGAVVRAFPAAAESGAHRDSCEVVVRPNPPWEQPNMPARARVFNRTGGRRFGHAATLDHVEGLLRAAVARRLESDVPLGCLLSGGVDSSLVAAFARDAAPDLLAVTVRMPDERYDESPHARAVAAHLGLRHVLVDPPRASPAEDLVMLIRTLGLPFGDSSLLPTYWACRAAAEHVGVALSGDGGDELFLGYDRYRAAGGWMRLSELARGLVPIRLFETPDSKSARAKVHRLLEAGRAGGYSDLLAIFPHSELELLFKGSKAFESRAAQRPNPRSFAAARRYELSNHLPGDYLRKADTASMIAGLELRAPLLDVALANEVLGLPVRVLRTGGRKGLLRDLARRRLPSSVVDRPKMGFAIPLGDWFRTDFGGLGSLLRDHLHAAEPFGPARLGIDLDREYLLRIEREHFDMKRDHAQRLYMLLVLSIWARHVGSVIQPHDERPS
ncbi:MAG: asparagine synthase (glutamine-hydrolyzing) [Phycisphaerae bacterium]|nr:asparagine synthase (glutamine-hydrolyzing) [Phycisphaerae bacterium]